MRWMENAACRGKDTQVFFPSEEEKHMDRKIRELRAKAICETCSVIEPCLAAGEGEEGIWGGLTEAERSGRHRRRKLSRPMVEMTTPGENPWVVIDGEGGCQIWQRETEKTWHGVEWAVVKNQEIIYISHNLDDTYARYGSLIHS